MDYRQLRAEYDAAFDQFRRAEWELRFIRQQCSPDKTAEDAVRPRVDQAMGVYRACRKNLADSLISHLPAGEPAVPMGSQPLGIWRVGIDRRAAGSSDTVLGRRNDVQVLAYRLWEEAGRPLGSADENWYRAEDMLRSGR